MARSAPLSWLKLALGSFDTKAEYRSTQAPLILNALRDAVQRPSTGQHRSGLPATIAAAAQRGGPLSFLPLSGNRNKAQSCHGYDDKRKSWRALGNVGLWHIHAIVLMAAEPMIPFMNIRSRRSCDCESNRSDAKSEHYFFHNRINPVYLDANNLRQYRKF